MTVTIVLEAKAKPECLEQFEQALKANLPDTRAYDGCNFLDAYRNQDDATDVVIVEQWESKEHYEKYLAWRAETGMLDNLASLLTGPPSIRYYDRMDV